MSDNLDRNLRKLLRLSAKPHVPSKDTADRVFGHVMDRMKKEKEKEAAPPRSSWFKPLLAVAAMLLLFGLIAIPSLLPTTPSRPEPIAKAPVQQNVIAPPVKMDVAEIAPKDAPKTIQLKDGSTLEVFASSRVKVTTWADRNRPLIDLESGEVRCVVAKGNGSFRVRTPVGEAVALGTEFRVRLEEQPSAAPAQEPKGEEGMHRATASLLMTVAVLSGEVMVSDMDGMGRLACAGESVTVKKEQAVAENFRSGQLVPRLSDGRQGEPLAVRRHNVDITVRDQIALVEVDQVFYNPSADRLEGTFFFPLPNGATICRLAMYVGDNLMEGEIAEAARARRTFEALKVQRVDPALLEWAGGNNFKMRVFPIEPKSEKRVLISYYQVLEKENNRIKVAYPLVTDALQTHPIGELNIKVTLDSTPTIEQVKTPGFLPEMDRQPNHVALACTAKDARPERDFVAEFDLAKGEGELVVLPFWQAKDGDGYFLMIFSPELETLDSQRNVGTRSIFVLDKSGGLGSKYLALARKTVESALTMLKPGDQFDIVAYDTFAQPFRPGLVEASAENLGAAKEFLSGLKAMGASDLSAAWQATASLAGDQPTQIVYIGAGMSSLTSTKSGKLLQEASAAFGTAPVRIHCMPVGGIQDADFIGELAGRYSGTVRPLNGADDIEPNVADLMLDYGVPIYEKFQLSFEGVKVDEIYPKSLPNIAAGRQLFVFGRYLTQGAAKIDLKAQYKNQPYHKTFDVNFGSDAANTCIPPLWATRKIEHLQRETTFADPDESSNMVRTIVETSKRYTVMSQYTSFLVLETPEDYARYGIERRVREFGPYAGQGGESAAEQLKALQQMAQFGRPGKSGWAEAKGEGGGGRSFDAAAEGADKADEANAVVDGKELRLRETGERLEERAKKAKSLVEDTPAQQGGQYRRAAPQAEEQLRKQVTRGGGERQLQALARNGAPASNRFAAAAPPAPTAAMPMEKAAADRDAGFVGNMAAAKRANAEFETDQLAWARTDIFPAIEGAPSDYLQNWPKQWKHSPEEAMKLLRTLQSRVQSLGCEVTAFSVNADGKEVQQGSVWQLALDAAGKRYVTYRKGEDTKDVCDGSRLARFFPLLKYAATRSATPQDVKALAAVLPGFAIPWPEKMDWEYEVSIEQGDGLVLRLTSRNNKWNYVRLFLDGEQGPVSKIEVYQHRREKGNKDVAVLVQTVRVEKVEEIGGIKCPTVVRITNVPGGTDPRVLEEQFELRRNLMEKAAALNADGKGEDAAKLLGQIKPQPNFQEQVIRLTDVRVNYEPPAEVFKIEIPADWAIRDLDTTPHSGDRRAISAPYDPSARGFGRR